MKEFLEQLAKLLNIQNSEKLKEEELKNVIIESIEKNFKLGKSLYDLFEETSCNTEFSIRVTALTNLLITRIYEEKDKNLNSFIKFALEEFARLLPIENISYMEKHAKWNYLLLKAASGKIKFEDFEVKKFPLKSSIAGHAYKTGNYIYVPNTHLDSRFNKKLSHLPIKTLLSVPIRDRDRIIGILNFSHAFEEAFNDISIYLLVSLTNLFSSLIVLFNFYHEKTSFNSKLLKEVDRKTLEIQRINLKLYKTSITDALTGLYNRRFFFQRLEEEFSRFLRYGSGFCLILFDLDRLKYINDKYGHLEGDRCLKLLAKYLRDRSRKEDVVARIGGDEFACILVGSTVEGGLTFSERIKEDLLRNYKKETLTVSAGAGCLGKGEYFKFYKNYKDFFKHVDKALLEAKKIRNHIKIIEH
ncbi:MAG: sensor domain-containing diguanylate cyclase [Thermodesulfovibrio sp.]|nr:sensor domain-containing diguanylate cyclase [Thermodesulfovibrio sp.]